VPSDIADWPSPLARKLTRTYFSSSQMNAIAGFSAPLNGARLGYPPKASSHQKRETWDHQVTDVEKLSQTGPMRRLDLPSAF
jgi:hypothetical protein